jgi:hypothetical protein
VSTRGVHSMLACQRVPILGRHGRGSDSSSVPLAPLSVSRRWLPPTGRTLSAVAFHGSGVARGGPAGVDGGQVGGCPTTRSSRRPSPCHAACSARVAPRLVRGLPRTLDRQKRPGTFFYERHSEGTLITSASATPGSGPGRAAASAVPLATQNPTPCRRHRWRPCINSSPRALCSAAIRAGPGYPTPGVHSLQSLVLARRSRSVGPRASMVVKLVAVQQRGQAATLRRVTPRAGHASRHGSGAAYRAR